MRFAWPLVPVLVVVVPFSMFGLLRANGLLLFLTAGVAVLAVSIGMHDPWAGTMAVYVILRWLTPPQMFGMETTVSIVFGLSLMMLAQRIPKEWDPCVRWAVTLAALAQVVVATGQAFLYDPLWLGFSRNALVKVHGTLGNPMYMGTFVAIAGATAPVPFLPVVFLGVFLSKSATAAVAFAAALLVRWRSQWKITLPVAGAVLGLVLWARHLTTWTIMFRLAVWMAALGEWTRAPLFGYGPGGWLRAWPNVGKAVPVEIYAQAHNEYVQILFEGGLVGLVLLVGWVWAHRGAIAASDWFPSVVAVSVSAFAFFPFQVPGTAVVSLLMLGLASRQPERI